MRVRVLGSIQVVMPDGSVVEPGSPTQRRLLAALAVTPRRPVRAETLAETAGLSMGALRVSISRLRRLLGTDAIATAPTGYRLEVDTDAELTVAALRDANGYLPSLEAALKQWLGEPFAEFAGEPWAAPEAARLCELHAVAIEDRSEALLEAGRSGEALAALRAHIGAHPWRDRPRGLLLRALAAEGRTREALQSYHEYRTTLVDESGLEPSVELQQIEHRVAGGWDGRNTDRTLTLRHGSRERQAARALIGREAELAALEDAFAAVTAGHRLGVVILVGDAGIGKTSLLEAFAHFTGAGTLVVRGRCDEAASVPLQPFRTVVEQLVTLADDAVVAAHADQHDRILGLVAPAFVHRVGPHASYGADEATDQFLLFEAITDIIRRSSESQPLVLLLDDLHWAEPTALHMLRHLARSAPNAEVLVVVSSRPAHEADSNELRSALADLARAPSMRIDLDGLGRSALDQLVRTMTGAADSDGGPVVDHEVIELLEGETAGNPLFATHLVRHWIHTGRLDATDSTVQLADRDAATARLPPTLRDIVWARLRSLGPDAPEVLSAATVLGNDITESSLTELADVSAEVVASVLDRAARAGIVSDVPGRSGAVRFTHALVASAIGADLSSLRRRRLHERAARALEVGSDRSVRTLTRIAHHWELAASPADALRAALDAGDAALASLAADEAAEWYRRAAAHTEEAGISDARRAAVLVQLGRALLRTGDADALETLVEAAQLARRHGANDTLVQAALSTRRGFVRVGDFAPTQRQLVQEALAVVPDDDIAARAQLLAMLGAALTGSPDSARREAAATEALALANALDDPQLIARLAPDILCALWTPITAELRAEISNRAVSAAIASGDPYLRFVVNVTAFNTAVSLGDAARADAALAAMRQVLESHSEPRMRWSLGVVETFVATMAGRFEEAQRLADASVELGMSLGEPDAFSVFASQFFVIGTFAGRYAQILPVVDQVLAGGEAAMPFRLAHAIACAVSGRRDEATAVLEAGQANGFARVTQDLFWLTTIVGYAVLAIELDDRVAAAELLPMLEPYASQVAFNGATSQGPVAAYLGRLASMLGRFDEADRHLRVALATTEAFGWEYHRASTLVCLAETRLRRTGAPDDDATALLDEAQRICDELGIGWWADRITTLRHAAPTLRGRPPEGRHVVS